MEREKVRASIVQPDSVVTVYCVTEMAGPCELHSWGHIRAREILWALMAQFPEDAELFAKGKAFNEPL